MESGDVKSGRRMSFNVGMGYTASSRPAWVMRLFLKKTKQKIHKVNKQNMEKRKGEL
jgi:hypothetical protein